jgi:hypothetical protein
VTSNANWLPPLALGTSGVASGVAQQQFIVLPEKASIRLHQLLIVAFVGVVCGVVPVVRAQSSAEESVMEGVHVSAKKDCSTVTVAVVSENGRYSFPADRTESGHYTPRSDNVCRLPYIAADFDGGVRRTGT